MRIIPPIDSFPVDAAALAKFRANWPGHGLDAVDHLTFWFTENGELQDFDAFDANGTRIDLPPDDKVLGALSALAEVVWLNRDTPEKLR